MPFVIIRADITTLKVDAIVNAANTDLAMGGGVCGAIFKSAGQRELQAACDKVAPITTGEAAITPGFNLPAKYVIHAAGPVYRDGNSDEEQQLRDAYTNSMKRAVENNCESIAFPLISSGIYGYPKGEALRVATSAIQDFLTNHDLDVRLAVFDKSAFTISEKLLGKVASYIDEHYVDKHRVARRKLLCVERDALHKEESLFFESFESKPALSVAPCVEPSDEDDTVYSITRNSIRLDESIDDLVGNLDEPFSKTLLRLIDRSGKTDAEVYKSANLDRRLFSKIRSNVHYAPSKPTVLALAIALQLSLSQTEDLLERAGFALSHSRKFDVIIEYFITEGQYNIFQINEVLFKYDQPLLGG